MAPDPHPPPDTAPRTGSDEPVLIAGRYRIERRLARGGQASVYLARQEPLGRRVALKILAPPADIHTEELDRFVERFELEARTLAKLDHPHIVTVHDFGKTKDGEFFIAMEYVDGYRFNDLLKQGRLDSRRALDLVRQVCLALDYAHRQGIIHRDIKNSNVLVKRGPQGREVVKVVDFGIVKLRDEGATLTQVGIILGSPHFMAPEQAQGRPIDHRVDVYAVGVLLYCALTGRYPFNGHHSTAILTAHLTKQPPRFHEIAPDLDVPDGLEDIVLRCLAKDPNQRYPHMLSLVQAIDAYLGTRTDMGPPDELNTLATSAQEPPPSRLAAMLGVLAGLLLVTSFTTFVVLGVVAIWMYFTQPEAPAPVVTEAAADEQPVVVTTTTRREGEEEAQSDEATETKPVTTSRRSTPRRSTTSSRSSSPTKATKPKTTTSAPTTGTTSEAAADATEPAWGTGPDMAAEPDATETTGTTTEVEPVETEPAEPVRRPGSDLLDPWAD